MPEFPDLTGRYHLDATIDEPEVVIVRDDVTGLVTESLPAGKTGVVLDTDRPMLGGRSGPFPALFYSVVRGVWGTAFGADGNFYMAGARIVGNDSGLFVYNDDGAVEFGLDGALRKATFAGGNGVIDRFGIIRTGVNYFDRWEVTDGIVSRRFEIATAVVVGAFACTLSWSDSAAGTNLQTNGDFEAGDLSSWDAADSGSPSWAADAAHPHGGSYAALLTTTGDTESNLQTNGDAETGDFTGWATGGTGTWSVDSTEKRSGTYSFKLSTTVSQTGTLTTNLGGTPRIAVTAGKTYFVRVYAESDGGGGYTTRQVLLKWYTATSGGSLISTDTISLSAPSEASDLWQTISTKAQKTAPATAAGVEVVLNLARSGVGGTDIMHFDDITFAEVQSATLTTNLGGTPRIAVTAGSNYSLSLDTRSDAVVGAWSHANILIKWYTATSGGSLVSTETIPLSPGLNAYANNGRTVTVPATAAGAELVPDMLRGMTDAGAINFYFDDIVFQAVTVNQRLVFTDDGVFTNDAAGTLRKLQGISYALIEDQKAQNTSGGTFTSGADRTRDLNTEVSDPDGIVSISSNQFTLGSGTYLIEWSAPAFAVDRHQSMLYSVTGSAILKRGQSTNAANAVGVANLSTGAWRLTIAASTTFEIRHRCQTTRVTSGFGVEGNFGVETYTTVKITKYG